MRTSSLVLLAILLVAGCGSGTQLASPSGADNPDVVATYAGTTLTLDEFERQYARSTVNQGAPADDSLAQYHDFLRRYVDFRLKVLAAEEAGIPSLPDVRDEIASYRSRLARPYLMENEVLDPITREIFERQKQLVDASHILLRIAPNASPADTAATYNRLAAIRDSATQGIDFRELAVRHSEDPSAGGNPGAPGYGGRLGFFTGGSLVEPFETYAYETPIGSVSPVFRTQFGYHILKVHTRMPSPADIRVSHIMLRPGPTAEDSANALSEIRGLRQRLGDGADFEALAREYSDDQQSSARGGDLGMLAYTSQVPEPFREAAFNLEEAGDVSDVVETTYGYHLIQLTGREEAPTYRESFQDLKALAERLPRTRAAESALARQIIRDRSAVVDTAAALAAFDGVPPDSLPAALTERRIAGDALSDTFFMIADTAFTVGDLEGVLEQSMPQNNPTTEGRVRAMVEYFVTDRAIGVEARHLGDRDPEFARLMKEFRDGLVLFELMEDSVWTVAQEDSAALRAHYEAHADEYRWPERIRVLTLESASDSALAKAIARGAGMESGDLTAEVASDSADGITVDTTMIADSTYAIYDRVFAMEPGDRTDVLSYRGAYVVVVHDGVEAPRGKTFAEARASVVNEYQQIVEDRLLERLRRRYDARTYPQRLDRAFADTERPPADRTAQQ